MGGPCRIRIVLLLQASGFSIQIMHGILRTVVAAVVLLAFSLSTTDLSLLLGASLKAAPEEHKLSSAQDKVLLSQGLQDSAQSGRFLPQIC